MPERLRSLTQWLRDDCALPQFDIQLASGDASFRRYFRISCGGVSYIAMDAPPERENCEPFVHIAEQLRAIGLNVPRVHAQDPLRGFLLLDDLGSEHYLDLLDSSTVERLYGDALSALMVMQACAPHEGLPIYDEALLREEMALFVDWLLGAHLALDLMDAEQRALVAAFDLLVANAQAQPRVFVHRDYHSRNLLRTEPPTPGILDFQDAVIGPVTYDLVSLLKDCYVRWPAEQVRHWAHGYFQLCVHSGVLAEIDEARFIRWFDLMGVQRHLKAAGIFARLHHRDGKPGYLADIPRTLGYIVELADEYPELSGLCELVEQRVLPALG